MEFPLVPWLAAAASRTLGTDERVMRMLAAAFSIATFLLFCGLARRALPPAPALFATAAYALSPLAVYLATRMQPEPFMTFFLLLAGRSIWRWYDEPSAGRLLAAAAALGRGNEGCEPLADHALVLGRSGSTRPGSRTS